MDPGHQRQSSVLSGAPRGPQRTATRIAVVACLGLAVVSALQLWVARRAAEEPTSAASVLLYGAVAWLPWAVVAPLILAMGRRFDFGPGRRLASLAAHAPVFLLCHVPAATGLVLVAMRLFGTMGREVTRAEIMGQVFAGTRLQLGLLVYAGIVGLGHAVATWEALRARELQAARLEGQATRARLEALAARLQPHFLFNTLAAIGALIEEDPAKARTMLTLLGDLLREVIPAADEGDIPLREELALLERYLAIEQLRFADRLRVAIEAAPDTLAFRVPRLLLQPLAENAIRHGLAPRIAGGTLRVRTCRDAGRLLLAVENDGQPLPTAVPEGVGLATTRERLATRQPAGTLSLTQRGALVVAEVTLPDPSPAS